MITLTPTLEQIKRAEELYDFHNLNNSITKGKSQIYGALGEILVMDYYNKNGVASEYKGSYDYDITIAGKTVDVKTKRTTVTPQPHYFCPIAAFNTKQRCDFYYFVRILEDLSKAFLQGYIGKDEFFKRATFHKSGEIDPSGDGKWTFKSDNYNLPMSKLYLKEYGTNKVQTGNRSTSGVRP